MIANQLETWRSNGFIVDNIDPLEHRHQINKAPSLRLLLRDQALARNLGRRTVWHFGSIETFETITTCIPEATEYAGSIFLWWFPERVVTAFGRINAFIHLTSLSIRIANFSKEVVNFNWIVVTCPVLKTLLVGPLL